MQTQSKQKLIARLAFIQVNNICCGLKEISNPGNKTLFLLVARKEIWTRGAPVPSFAGPIFHARKSRIMKIGGEGPLSASSLLLLEKNKGGEEDPSTLPSREDLGGCGVATFPRLQEGGSCKSRCRCRRRSRMQNRISEGENKRETSFFFARRSFSAPAAKGREAFF